MSRLPFLRPAAPTLRGRPAGSGSGRRWAPALGAGLVWLLVGLSAGYWALQALGRAPRVELPAQPVARTDIQSDHVVLALRGNAGGPAGTVPAADNGAGWQLLGVVATRDGQGAALLAQNNERPRPVRVGQPVGDSGLVLQAIEGRSVRLGPSAGGPSTVQLSLPSVPGPAATP